MAANHAEHINGAWDIKGPGQGGSQEPDEDQAGTGFSFGAMKV